MSEAVVIYVHGWTVCRKCMEQFSVYCKLVQSFRSQLTPLTYIHVGDAEVDDLKRFFDGFKSTLFCVLDFTKGTTITFNQRLA